MAKTRRVGLAPVRSVRELRGMNEELKQKDIVCENVNDNEKDCEEGTIKGNVSVMFDGLDLSEMLAYLRDEGYSLDSIGFGRTWSISDSITVCGFKSEEGFCYVAFYYENVFMTRIISVSKRLREVEVNGYTVKLRKLALDEADEVSTLVRGFDVCNFQEYNLLQTA